MVDRMPGLCRDPVRNSTAATPAEIREAGRNSTPMEQEDGMLNDQEVFKEPNQEAKADAGKPRLTLVPTEITWAIAAVRGYGVRKYPKGGEDNWKRVEVQRYRDAAYRHFLRYIENPQSVDEDSGLPHLWHCVTNLAFLIALDKDSGYPQKEDVSPWDE